ncbi:MAG: type II toxin-antitoxin system PemK/MazF family toxin [Propionibacteriaceae bacterium]|jgi:mRNA interferase MazF|nr:type II toxin-antitoxin system PemK/MazF family toxin [Propionibacteriaceae bacterium]
MRRGEVWLGAFDPAQGSEAAKTRPCVVVSADASNRVVERLARGVVTVVPLTTNTTRVHDFQVLIPAEPGSGLAVDSKAQAEQIRALDCTRLIRQLGRLNAEEVAALDEALRLHLGLGYD